MHIGILETGLPPDTLPDTFTDYPGMFESLLAGRGFTFQTWSVVNGVLPDRVDAADGWLITGSKHGAYEDHPWIPPLESFIRALHADGRPLVGICFGHQIIAQALGGRVEKFDGGWSVGRTTYRFGGEDVALNAWHQDQVVEKPDGAEVIAATDFCRYAGLAYGNTILTLQPHPEYSADFIRFLIDARGGAVPAPLKEAAIAAMDTPTDRTAVGQRIGDFFLSHAKG